MVVNLQLTIIPLLLVANADWSSLKYALFKKNRADQPVEHDPHEIRYSQIGVGCRVSRLFRFLQNLTIETGGRNPKLDPS